MNIQFIKKSRLSQVLSLILLAGVILMAQMSFANEAKKIIESKEVKAAHAEKIFKTLALLKPELVAGAGDKNSLVITAIMAGYEYQYNRKGKMTKVIYTVNFNSEKEKDLNYEGNGAKIIYDLLEEYFPESQDSGEDAGYYFSSRLECLRSVDYYTCTLFAPEPF
jgi:hypothetical protein